MDTSSGGTTLGSNSGTISPTNFVEYVWNDGSGATGGGVCALSTVANANSIFNQLPDYQNGIGVPASVNDGRTVGRGVPDVAGNASTNSGYRNIFVNGVAQVGSGTSAVTPSLRRAYCSHQCYAGERAGFLNRALYSLRTNVCRDINPTVGPQNK